MMNKPKEIPSADIGRRKRKNDMLMIFALLFLVCLAGIIYFLGRQKGNAVSVTVDGALFGEYDLNLEQTVEIQTELGRNLLVIKDGKAFVSEADCPDGICQAHRAIQNDGEMIVCLPHKLVIAVSAS